AFGLGVRCSILKKLLSVHPVHLNRVKDDAAASVVAFHVLVSQCINCRLYPRLFGIKEETYTVASGQVAELSHSFLSTFPLVMFELAQFLLAADVLEQVNASNGTHFKHAIGNPPIICSFFDGLPDLPG